MVLSIYAQHSKRDEGDHDHDHEADDESDWQPDRTECFTISLKRNKNMSYTQPIQPELTLMSIPPSSPRWFTR